MPRQRVRVVSENGGGFWLRTPNCVFQKFGIPCWKEIPKANTGRIAAGILGLPMKDISGTIIWTSYVGIDLLWVLQIRNLGRVHVRYLIKEHVKSILEHVARQERERDRVREREGERER